MVCKASTFSGVHKTDKVWTNWSGEVQFRATQYWEPAHSAPDLLDGLQQLVHVVSLASDGGQRVHAIGSGWAFEDLAGSDAWVVCLRGLDRQLTYVLDSALTAAWTDELARPMSTRRLVHVEAGIRIAALSEMLEGQGLALPTLGGSNGQSLAGAISTSTHGGDWQQPPLPGLVRALHLVTAGGQELWIEPGTPLTTDLLHGVLPCPETIVIRDDQVFAAALVTCGRFGVAYSYVLEVTTAFREVEVVTQPAASAVRDALRDGVAAGTLFQPVFDLLAADMAPPELTDATGTPYFLQLLFNSQHPQDVWASRRWVTTDPHDISGPAPGSDNATAILIFNAANAAFPLLSLSVQAIPLYGVYEAVLISGVATAFNLGVASRPFTLGSVVAAALGAMWRIPEAGDLVPTLNRMVLDGGFKDAVAHGRRGPHYLITSGTRASSDSTSYRAASIELIFDATTTDYLDFLDQVFAVAPSFQQAGYISLRPSLASSGSLSMHNVPGGTAISIEISSLQALPGNDAWMHFVHTLAVSLHGRPHWGQYNKLDALDVSMLYGPAVNDWREALLRVSGLSEQFSNGFSRARGLEPLAIQRQVTQVRKSSHGAITHVCNDHAAWSPVAVADAIDQIESGVVHYFVADATGVVAIHVVGGSYLRTVPDASAANNLDNLPPG